jgi:hypothetical protein
LRPRRYSGISLAYPVVFQSYDPADPTGATTKFGELLGANRPRITTTNNFAALGFPSAGTKPYRAWKGLEFIGSGADSAFSNSGTHNGLKINNCAFREIRWLWPDGDIHGASKISMLGAWSTGGNFSNMYSGNCQNQWVEDFINDHGGWRVGSTRDDAVASGGVHGNVLAHGEYFGDQCTGIRRRGLYVHSAVDGRNYRGDLYQAGNTPGATAVTSWDEPFAAVIAGYSASYTEKPLGSFVIGADWVNMGNDRTWNGAPGVGTGFNISQASSGSGVNGFWAFDALQRRTKSCRNARRDSGQINPRFLITNARVHNYPDNSFSFNINGTGTLSQMLITLVNSITDNAITGTSNLSVSGNTTWGGSPPASATRAAVLTSLGFNSASYNSYNEQKADYLNWRHEYPHLDWDRPLVTVAAQKMGSNPTSFTPTTTPPDLTGLTAPRVIYGTTFTAMALADSSFTHSVNKTVNITGIPTGWMVWSDNLPSGFAIDSYARTLTYTGTVAGSGSFTLKCGMPAATPYTQSQSYTIA